MTVLPKILIIDDFLGASSPKSIRNREAFCSRSGIKDITGDSDPMPINPAVAEALFFSGQNIIDGSVENDLQGTVDFINTMMRGNQKPALILLDLHFKTGKIVDGEAGGRPSDWDSQHYFGLDVLKHLSELKITKKIPVVILSSMERGEIEAAFSGYGALDFIDKSRISREIMSRLIEDYGMIGDDDIIGKSFPLLKCLQSARMRSRKGNENILILGESGTGKELLARYIHKHSGRKGRFVTFFAQSCPENLIESELFGYEKGAFTGAAHSQAGKAELADGGTLFIDEFGDMPGSIQNKLLRLLDKNMREAQKIGSTKIYKLDLQVVLATSRTDLIDSKNFRKDLLVRVNRRKALILPPLRERDGDIKLLAEYFLKKFEKKFKAQKRILSESALELMKQYPWPGNIRELSEEIEQAVYHFSGLKILSPNHIFSEKKIQGENSNREEVLVSPKDKQGENEFNYAKEDSLDDLLTGMLEFNVKRLPPTALKGKLTALQKAYAHLAAEIVKSGVNATKRSTIDSPEGEIKIHPAIKLLTGNKKLTASKSADIIKKVFKIDPETSEQLLSADTELKKIHNIAIGLRPTSGKIKRK